MLHIMATIGRDFKLDVTGTFTSYNNKIVDIPGFLILMGDVIRNNRLQRYQEGHPSALSLAIK